MKKIIIICLILFFISSTSVLSADDRLLQNKEVISSANRAYAQGELIIGFKDGVSIADLTTFSGYKIKDKIAELNIALIEVDKGCENKILTSLRGKNEISFADYNSANTLNEQNVNVPSEPGATITNSCWTILKDTVQTLEGQQSGYENTEHRFCMIASIVGDVHKASHIVIFRRELGIEGLAQDVKVKPLIGEAFYIGDNYDGPDYFRASIFIGSFNEYQVNGIALFLWIGDWYYKPSSYTELVDWYKALETVYPDYLEVFKANELYCTGTVPNTEGDTNPEDDYDLYYIRITNESRGLHKPEVLFLGNPHGDETTGTIGLYWFTDWLMRMAFTDELCSEYSKEWLWWLIDNREIYIEVSHNPYGFDLMVVNNDLYARFDAREKDLDRETDYNRELGEVWGSVNGRTLRAFVDNHTIRVGCDFHDGVRNLLYPWSSAHENIIGTSPISGWRYKYSPPDFYFFDASSLRLGDYIGNYGGNFYPLRVGPWIPMLGYIANGSIVSWAYGADVMKNPAEDPYVQDEIFGNYPGAGILWLTPEIFGSFDKNPPEIMFGNDDIPRFGAEIRRFVLHQTDLAQPYVRWQPGTNEGVVNAGTQLTFKWQVNGSLVVDHTYINWGTNSDPINYPQHTSIDHDEHAGDYIGGTGWDNAESGKTNGVTYTETITLDTPGDYYFVAKAQVDQIYANVLRPDVYGDKSYLRLIKERTNSSYYELLEGTDGTEEIIGQTWWHSPIIHITVTEGNSQSEQTQQTQQSSEPISKTTIQTTIGSTTLLGKTTSK